MARLASIPHGTAIVAQGTASTSGAAPDIPDIGIKPFKIGDPSSTSDLPEQTLTTPSKFRTSGPGLTGITQEMVNSPNSVLRSAISGQQISATTILRVATDDTPVAGGGIANTAFLKGTVHGPNAERRKRHVHVLAGDNPGTICPQPAAIFPDRAAELQRPELASYHGRHAAQSKVTLRVYPGNPSRILSGAATWR